MENNEITKKTRDIYQAQHLNYLTDDVTYQRFLKMVSDPAYFHLKKKDFAGKRILDAGCGNTGYFQEAMHNLGVEKCVCLDIGTEWIDPLKGFLDKKGITNIEYVSGSTDDLPFQDNDFDMVFSNGVLQHLPDMNSIRTAFSELARVTKPQGYLYVILSNPGGLLEEEIMPGLRRYYNKNAEFKQLVDSLDPSVFQELFATIRKGMIENSSDDFNSNEVAALFDIDFCTTAQNVMQVPKRWVLELDEQFVNEMYKNHNFDAPMRCRRYVERKNIRKFFAPLHYDLNNKFSKILYGPGNLEFIARKI